MKKIITSLAFIIPTALSFGQNKIPDLTFTTPFYQAVDKWIAFPKKEKDSTYSFGFIYIDRQAGFTFDLAGEFTISGNQLVNKPREEKSSLKIRLSGNTSDVVILNNEQLTQLSMPIVPQWLSIYKTDSSSISYLKDMGYHLNHVGASEQALKPLLQAYAVDPHFKGLEFEIAYAYNATKQYEKAIPILDKAIKNDSKNFFFYRELGFAYKYLNNVKEAEIIYEKGIAICDDNSQKAEMAVNMAQAFFYEKNKTKFDKWAALTRQYSEKNSQFIKYIDYFEANWNK